MEALRNMISLPSFQPHPIRSCTIPILVNMRNFFFSRKIHSGPYSDTGVFLNRSALNYHLGAGILYPCFREHLPHFTESGKFRVNS